MNKITIFMLSMIIILVYINCIPIQKVEPLVITYKNKKINSDFWNGKCLSPYCQRQWWWYNKNTPLPWGNSSIIPTWYYPPYAHIHNYYCL